MQKNVTYYRKNNHIECVFYKDSTQSYPMHTYGTYDAGIYNRRDSLCCVRRLCMQISCRRVFLDYARRSACD